MDCEAEMQTLIKYMEDNNIELGSSPAKAFIIAFERTKRYAANWFAIVDTTDSMQAVECESDNDRLLYEEAEAGVRRMMARLPKPAAKGRITQLFGEMQEHWAGIVAEDRLHLVWAHRTVADYKKAIMKGKP